MTALHLDRSNRLNMKDFSEFASRHSAATTTCTTPLGATDPLAALMSQIERKLSDMGLPYEPRQVNRMAKQLRKLAHVVPLKDQEAQADTPRYRAFQKSLKMYAVTSARPNHDD